MQIHCHFSSYYCIRLARKFICFFSHTIFSKPSFFKRQFVNELFKKIYLFLAVLGLGGCAWPFSLVAASGSYALVVVFGFFIEGASLVVEHSC